MAYSTISYARALNDYNNSVKTMNQLQVVKAVYDKHQEIMDLKVQVDAMYDYTYNNSENID